MRIFAPILLYLILSGAIMGLVTNSHSKTCGKDQRITTDTIAHMLAWPMALGLIITLDDGRDIKPLCDEE